MPYNDEESYGGPGYYSVNRFDQTVDVERLDDEDSSSNGSNWHQGAPCQTKSSGSASDSSSVMALPSRNPTCALCKNHRISSPLKGHKRYCPFGRCQCELCRVTRRKQKLNASQVAIRRAIQQDKELGIERPTPLAHPAAVNAVSAVSAAAAVAPPRMGYPRPLASSMDSRAIAARYGAHYEPSQAAAYPQQQSNSPVVFGENMSLECVLLGRSASLLMNALATSRLTHEQLLYLNHEIASAIRILTEEVTPHLNDIYRYLMDRLQREQAKNGANKTNFQGCISNQLPALVEITAGKSTADAVYTTAAAAASVSNHVQQQQPQPVRESVIFPPMDVSFPVYPQYGTQ